MDRSLVSPHRSFICLQFWRISDKLELTFGVWMEDCCLSIWRGINIEAESFSASLLDLFPPTRDPPGPASTGELVMLLPRLKSPSLSDRFCISESSPEKCFQLILTYLLRLSLLPSMPPRILTRSLSETLGGFAMAALGLAMLRFARPLESGEG